MNTSLVVIGFLNTSIIATGLKHFPRPGEHIYGQELIICPGGKSRNIATMAGYLMGSGRAAMVGRTTRDQYGLWKAPLEALHDAGVNTNFVVVDDLAGKLPSVALIAVDDLGSNQIIAVPGVGSDFCKEDIDRAESLFVTAAKNDGHLALTLQCPIKTAKYAVHKAKNLGLKVVFDPGGIDQGMEVDELLDGIFVIKPNEHEARLLTGITVRGFTSARRAADRLMDMGVENVLITAGSGGAYLFTPQGQRHILVPMVPKSATRNETGCGDQTMAALCAYLQARYSIEEASSMAVLAGTLQFYKPGIQPVTLRELEIAREHAYLLKAKVPMVSRLASRPSIAAA